MYIYTEICAGTDVCTCAFIHTHMHIYRNRFTYISVSMSVSMSVSLSVSVSVSVSRCVWYRMDRLRATTKILWLNVRCNYSWKCTQVLFKKNDCKYEKFLFPVRLRMTMKTALTVFPCACVRLRVWFDENRHSNCKQDDANHPESK